MDFTFIKEYYMFFAQGVGNTIALSFFAVLIGIILGVLLALMKLSKNPILKGISTTYIEFMRGTPLLIQILIVYMGTGLTSTFLSGLIAVALNSSAYIAEIIRAGIQAVDKGQIEAARSLGMNDFLAMKYIIIPQAIKNILPALGNEFVVVIKESSIASIIGVAELTYKGKAVASSTFNQVGVYIVIAILYFILTFTTSRLIGMAERRMKASDRD